MSKIFGFIIAAVTAANVLATTFIIIMTTITNHHCFCF
jgi:hypothetical protein